MLGWVAVGAGCEVLSVGCRGLGVPAELPRWRALRCQGAAGVAVPGCCNTGCQMPGTGKPERPAKTLANEASAGGRKTACFCRGLMAIAGRPQLLTCPLLPPLPESNA